MKEVEYFPTLEGDDVVEPHLNYTHCLYIYPESANFGNHSSFKVAAMSQNRNITVYVQLKLDDGPNAPALNSIFGKSKFFSHTFSSCLFCLFCLFSYPSPSSDHQPFCLGSSYICCLSRS